MGAIARNIANNITTGGVFTSSALNSSSVTGITVLANASDGITLISSQTASNSASISFTSGLTSTYKAYKFVFVNVRPATEDNSDGVEFTFNMSTDGGSNYNVTKTSTFFRTLHSESDVYNSLNYETDMDLAQSTAFQNLTQSSSADADHCNCGSLIIFNPSSTTYVKHFISDLNDIQFGDMSFRLFVAGYGNTTSAVNAVQFKFSGSNNISAGTIYLYGIK